jgi:hypothetical protein
MDGAIASNVGDVFVAGLDRGLLSGTSGKGGGEDWLILF